MERALERPFLIFAWMHTFFLFLMKNFLNFPQRTNILPTLIQVVSVDWPYPCLPLFQGYLRMRTCKVGAKFSDTQTLMSSNDLGEPRSENTGKTFTDLLPLAKVLRKHGIVKERTLNFPKKISWPNQDGSVTVMFHDDRTILSCHRHIYSHCNPLVVCGLSARVMDLEQKPPRWQSQILR